MKSTKPNAVRLQPKSITDIFKQSGKKHLIITGGISSGKSTLAGQCTQILCSADADKITTIAEPGKCVWFESSFGDRFAIAEYDKNRPGNKCKMKAVKSGFSEKGAEVLSRCSASEKTWCVIDEIGYAENSVNEYKTQLKRLFEQKRVIAVLRKQDTLLISDILRRKDVFVYDVDRPVDDICCVVMASGKSERFGKENKLLADMCGKPLVSYAIDTAKNSAFSDAYTVTIHDEVSNISTRSGVKCRLHSYEKKSDAIKLAVNLACDYSGIMFLNSDQPFVSGESIEKMVLAFTCFQNCIVRLSYGETESSPVIFPRSAYKYLSALCANETGMNAVKRSGLKIICVQAENEFEIFDVDTKRDLQNLSDIAKEHELF